MNTEKWIGDSGATVHITNNDKGMINVKECDFDITVGNEETVKCPKISDSNFNTTSTEKYFRDNVSNYLGWELMYQVS